MSKVIKIVIGSILLSISAFYLLGICLVVADAKEDAIYSLDFYIQAEQTGCEYLGKNPEINGREKHAEEGYGFYKITFEVENLSSEPYYGALSDIFDTGRWIDDENVGLMILPSPSGSPGYFETVKPVLPGKTTIKLVFYLEIREGVESVRASYLPAWEAEEVELDIVLND